MDITAFHTAHIDVVNVLRPISHNVSLELQASPSYPWNVPIYGTVMNTTQLFMLIETTCFMTAIWFTQYFPKFHAMPMGDIVAIAIGLLNSTQAGMTEEDYTWFRYSQGVNPYNPYLPEPYRSEFWDVYEAYTSPNGTKTVTANTWNSPYSAAGYFGNWRLDPTPNGILDRDMFYTNGSYGDKSGNFKATNPSRFNSPTNPISKAFEYDAPGKGLRTRSTGMQYSAYAFFMPFLPRGTKPSALVPVFAVFTALTTAVMGIRLWGRWAYLGGPKSFDYTIIVGWVLAVAWGIAAVVRGCTPIRVVVKRIRANQNTYIGRWNWDLSMTDLFSLPQLYVAIGVLYPIALFTVKTSILLLYRTLTEIRLYRIAIAAVFVICILNAALSVYTAYMTYNIKQFWAIVDNPATEFGYFKSMGAQLSPAVKSATMVAAGLNIATDALILALPLPLLGMVYKMSLKDTLLAGATFLAGSLAIVAGTLRMMSVKHYLYTPRTGDYSRIVTMNVWILVEMNVAIICASVPALRAIAMKTWPIFCALPFMKSIRSKLFGAEQPKRATKPSTPPHRGGIVNTLSWALQSSTLVSERRPSVLTRVLGPRGFKNLEDGSEKSDDTDVETGILMEGIVLEVRDGEVVNAQTTTMNVATADPDTSVQRAGHTSVSSDLEIPRERQQVNNHRG